MNLKFLTHRLIKVVNLKIENVLIFYLSKY